MTEIYIRGHITEVLPLRQGTSEKGSWESQDYVITPSEGGRPLFFSISGHDRIQQANLEQGKEYVLRLFVESRPYTNKETGQQSWFTSLTYGGSFGLPHWQFYNQAMYSLRAPGFGVSQGYEIRPVQLQQQAYQYPSAQQQAYPHQQNGGYGNPAGGTASSRVAGRITRASRPTRATCPSDGGRRLRT